MPRRSKSTDAVKYGGKEVNIDIYRESMSLTDMQLLRRKLAKRANQRIVRLERASSNITGEAFNEFGAVTDAYSYLERQKKGRKRFQERADAITDTMELRREISVLQGFLGSKTSLVSGIREIEQKRISTFESGNWGKTSRYTGKVRRGIKFASTKEFYEFLGSKTFQGLLRSGYTSEQLVEIYDEARESEEADEVLAKMEEALEEYRAGQKATLKDITGRFKMTKIM